MVAVRPTFHHPAILAKQAANVDRMNLKRRKAFYGDWWDEAAGYNSFS